MEGEDEEIDPDYGLDESIQEPGGDGHDEYNDDTFGDDVPTGGDWAQDSRRLAQLHETFLAERPSGAGFFELGNADGDELGALDGGAGDGELPMDASLLDMLDISSPPRRAPAARSGHVNGLRVSGLPPTLSEEQARQLLSHFGPLSSFELRREAAGSTAMLSYQNPAVAESACASLQGIPLGGRCAPAAYEACPFEKRWQPRAKGTCFTAVSHPPEPFHSPSFRQPVCFLPVWTLALASSVLF
jgi:hypothetical protein